MTARSKTSLKIVQPGTEQLVELEQVIQEAAAKQVAPLVQRLGTHRDRIDLAIKELESERFDLLSRRDLMRRQAEAVEQGLNLHLQDIEATLKLYESGINSVALPATT
jgi:excinuclease UvrABC nuclease subunit